MRIRHAIQLMIDSTSAFLYIDNKWLKYEWLAEQNKWNEKGEYALKSKTQ